MKRLLCIIGSMNVGGAETFLMKIYRSLNKEKYQMDFAVATTEKAKYDDEILSLGGRIYHITPKSQGGLKNFFDIRQIVKKNKYLYVMRVSQHSLSALELLAVWLGGAKVRVFRSSNSNTTGNKVNSLLHKLCMFMPKLFSNVRIAPSKEAAEFMFGKNCLEKGNAFLLHNAVNLDFYHFSLSGRDKIRNEFEITQNIVIGHIGRFNYQKNHEFLLEIFKRVKSKEKSAILLLAGVGELENKIRKKVQELSVEDSVIFAGIRSDIPEFLSAMDVFVMPSFYEGMPNTVIEAQATGLPCVIADTITKEANITGLVEYLPLTKSAEYWADKVLAAIRDERKDTKQDFIDNKYDIESVSEDFSKLVFER